MIRLPRLSLAALVTITLVTVTTLLLIIYSVISYQTAAHDQRRSFDRLIAIHATQTAVALELPAWNIDRAQIDHVIEAMVKPRSVRTIMVSAAGDQFGRTKNAREEIVPIDGHVDTTGMLVKDARITRAGRELGRVRVIATWANVDADLRSTRMQIIGAIVVIDVLLIVCVYLILWRTVLRPILDIERYAGAVSAGALPPATRSTTPAAELASLTSSITSMVGLLDRRYQDLASSEERFRTIFDSVNDAIFIHDRDNGAILDVNATACRMFGYSRYEMLQLDVGALSSGVLPYTGDNAVNAIRRARPGDLQLFEWHTRHRDGHLFWNEINMRSAKIAETPRVLVVARDITHRKTMEDELRQAEQMSRIGSLVAGVAHEVRNPLFGIAATLDAFEAEFGSRVDVAEYMTVLRNDVSRLSRLMNDLLDYGRPQRLERHMQSIEPVIDEALRVVAPDAKEKQIDIRREIEPYVPDVSIDSGRMMQVMRNVIENAIAFSRYGDSVDIRVRIVKNGAPSVVCTVSDHGPGFPPADLDRVFDPFFTRRSGGSGLGLAIVQKIVADHDGTISASNHEGGGATVEIRLPAQSR